MFYISSYMYFIINLKLFDGTILYKYRNVFLFIEKLQPNWLKLNYFEGFDGFVINHTMMRIATIAIPPPMVYPLSSMAMYFCI